MKSATTLIFRAEPWLKFVLSFGANAGWSRPSSPLANFTVGLVLEQEPIVVPAAEDAAPVLDAAAAEAALVAAGGAASQEELSAPLATAAPVPVAEAAPVAFDAAAPAPALAVTPPATAALISSTVASSTRRFCVKMQPTGSFWSSQELPLPVLSFRSPGAKVPALRAVVASPPMLAIC